MDDQSNTKKAAYATLEFLDEEFKKSTTSADSKESLEVAIQCLETAFGISLTDTQYRPSKSLRELVKSPGAAATGGEAGAAAGASVSSASYNPLAGASVRNFYI